MSPGQKSFMETLVTECGISSFQGKGRSSKHAVSLILLTCLQFYASNGQEEDPAVFEFGARSRDMVEPLSEQEEQPFRFWEWLKW